MLTQGEAATGNLKIVRYCSTGKGTGANTCGLDQTPLKGEREMMGKNGLI